MCVCVECHVHAFQTEAIIIVWHIQLRSGDIYSLVNHLILRNYTDNAVVKEVDRSASIPCNFDTMHT